jgi:transcriptional regulator with XRE-family HTH domain
MLYAMTVRFSEHRRGALRPDELGAWIRAERTARGRSQAWIAARVGVRRQTIADLEAGRNVELRVLFGALTALGKGLAIVDARIDLERLNEVFRDED